MSWFTGLFGSSASATQTTPARKIPVSAQDVSRDIIAYVASQSKGRWTTDSIDPAGHLFEDGYLDSLGIVDLLTFIDAAFGVSDIPKVDLVGRLGTFNALARYVFEHTANDGGGK